MVFRIGKSRKFLDIIYFKYILWSGPPVVYINFQLMEPKEDLKMCPINGIRPQNSKSNIYVLQPLAITNSGVVVFVI